VNSLKLTNLVRKNYQICFLTHFTTSFCTFFFKLRTNKKINTRQFFNIGIYMHLRN